MTAPKKPETRRSILLVEDDASTRQVITKHLAKAGFSITPVESAEAVMPIRQERGTGWDVVISDVHLPGISGIDLASVLLTAWPGQPLILITGDPDEAMAREALSRGPVRYLLKPFQLLDLELAVREALNESDRRRGDAMKPVNRGSMMAGIPADWLDWVDERSYAGAGHAYRVAKLAVLLLDKLDTTEVSAAELSVAAQAHEFGIMSGTAADPIELARRGADQLAELGAPAAVVQMIRHMHERWDGSGGPDQLRGGQIPLGSAILSIADSLDHYAAAWMQAGMAPIDAVDRAFGLILVQQETVFDPRLARIMADQRAAIREIAAVKRSTESGTTARNPSGAAAPAA